MLMVIIIGITFQITEITSQIIRTMFQITRITTSQIIRVMFQITRTTFQIISQIGTSTNTKKPTTNQTKALNNNTKKQQLISQWDHPVQEAVEIIAAAVQEVAVGEKKIIALILYSNKNEAVLKVQYTELSFPRMLESSLYVMFWIPVFTGMTPKA